MCLDLTDDEDENAMVAVEVVAFAMVRLSAKGERHDDINCALKQSAARKAT